VFDAEERVLMAANLNFTVDTHLLRELGELLVGRDSTAVIELVKNSYDADATVVRLHACNLRDPQVAELIVEDNGNGMTLDRFRTAFLRIAGRDKEGGSRTSPRYSRAYTGQKGIGRLASQKLAGVLEIRSVPNEHVAKQADTGVHARIDWGAIDEQETLNELNEGLDVAPLQAVVGMSSGTRLAMSSLKKKWSDKQIAKFVREVKSALPPAFILNGTSDSLGIAASPLFGMPNVRLSSETDPGFELHFSGDFEQGDEYWDQARDRFSWCVEVDVANGVARFQITPMCSEVEENAYARQYYFERQASPGLMFQARYFVYPRASANRGPLNGFVRDYRGIRIYLEGFRVLPYADGSDDWLNIDRDYRSGPRYYEIEIDEQNSDAVDADRREALDALSQNSYFGAVFLTESGAPGLKSLVNREGFVPGATFDEIREIVATSVKLSVRVRRSVRLQRERYERNERHVVTDVNSKEVEADISLPSQSDHPARANFELLTPRRTSLNESKQIEAAVDASQTLLSNYKQTDIDLDKLLALDNGFHLVSDKLRALEEIQPELRILAGVGLQLGAFVHDINGMISNAATVTRILDILLDSVTDRGHRKLIKSARTASLELAHTLSRQSSYLTNVLTNDPRRRRSRCRVLEHVQSVLRFLAPKIANKNISVHVNVSETVRTLPMFPAELTILLTNVLANAVKNAASEGSIWVDVEELASEIAITVSNDGVIVNLDEAERWFLPFESTTTVVDEVLGQGLGLGLPIVRALTDDYRGSVHFVPPRLGAATSIRITLPKKEVKHW
jgi:histidine kinase